MTLALQHRSARTGWLLSIGGLAVILVTAFLAVFEYLGTALAHHPEYQVSAECDTGWHADSFYVGGSGLRLLVFVDVKVNGEDYAADWTNSSVDPPTGTQPVVTYAAPAEGFDSGDEPPAGADFLWRGIDNTANTHRGSGVGFTIFHRVGAIDTLDVNGYSGQILMYELSGGKWNKANTINVTPPQEPDDCTPPPRVCEEDSPNFIVKFEWNGNSYQPEGGNNFGITLTPSTTSGQWQSATYFISAITLKGSLDTDNVSYNPATLGPENFSNANLTTPSGGPAGISHINFCGDEPEVFDITICKRLFGNNDGIANDSGTFTFKVINLANGEQIGPDVPIVISANDSGSGRDVTECSDTTIAVPEGTRIQVVETLPDGWVNSTEDTGVNGVNGYPWYHVDNNAPFLDTVPFGVDGNQFGTQTTNPPEADLAGTNGVQDDHTVTIKNRREKQFKIEVCKLVFGNGDGIANDSGTFTFRVEDLDTQTTIAGPFEITVSNVPDGGSKEVCHPDKIKVEKGTRVRVVEVLPDGWVNSPDDPDGAATIYPWYHVDGTPSLNTQDLGGNQYATLDNDGKLADDDGVTQNHKVTIKNKPADDQRVNVCKTLIESDGGPSSETFHLRILVNDVVVAEGDLTVDEGTTECLIGDGDDPVIVSSGDVVVAEEVVPVGWEHEAGYPKYQVNGGTLFEAVPTGDEREYQTNGADGDGDPEIVVASENLTITFENKAGPRFVRVCKDVIDEQDGAPTTNWTFTVDFGGQTQVIEVDIDGVEAADEATDNCTELIQIPAGSDEVEVIESLLASGSWDTSWAADNADGNSGDGTTANVTISEADGEITIIFTNERVLFEVTVCKLVVDNNALPDGEGATFPVDIDHIRNGVANTDDTASLPQDEDNEEESCTTRLVDRDSVVTVAESGLGGLSQVWTFLGSNQVGDLPGDYEADNSYTIDEDGEVIYVYNTRPSYEIEVCKTVRINEESVVDPQGGEFSFTLVINEGTEDEIAVPFNLTDTATTDDIEERCATFAVSEGVDVDVTEEADRPATWKADGATYPRVSVDLGAESQSSTTSLDSVTGDHAIEFFNRLPADPEIAKQPAEISVAEVNGVMTAFWQIIITNSGPDSIPHDVTVSDPNVVLSGAAPVGCSGDISTAQGITCPLPANGSVILDVQQAVGQQCLDSQALNSATIQIDEEPPFTATSTPITIPGDDELCDDPSIVKTADGFNAGTGFATWAITINNQVPDTTARTVWVIDTDVQLVGELPGNCTGAITTGMTCTIAANGSLTFQVQRAIDLTCEPQVATNSVEARLDGPDGDLIQGSPSTAPVIEIPGDADLCDTPNLSKAATGFVVASSQATWQIVIANTEANAIDRVVVVTDQDVTLVATLPVGACTIGTLATGLQCNVPAGTTLQIFVSRGVGQVCEPQIVTNTASAIVLGDGPLDGSPTGIASVTVPAIDGPQCDTFTLPTPTPTEPGETPTEPGETPTEPEETPTEPTAVDPTVVTPEPTETEEETPEPTATATPEPTIVLPTVVIPTPPSAGSGTSPIGSQGMPVLAGLFGAMMLAMGAGILLNASRQRV